MRKKRSANTDKNEGSLIQDLEIPIEKSGDQIDQHVMDQEESLGSPGLEFNQIGKNKGKDSAFEPFAFHRDPKDQK